MRPSSQPSKDMSNALRNRGVIASITLSLLFGGLLLDLTTQQDIVVAIAFNIPIAVSGLANSPRLTQTTVVLALVANIAAAYENALTFGDLDTITVANRSLAGLSFLIVGGVTLAHEGAVDRAAIMSRSWAGEADLAVLHRQSIHG
jgi:hypothetical protein